MKTAKEYLREAIGYELNSSHMTYVDALAAVQAAIEDAGSVRDQVRQGLADYFDEVLPLPPLPPLPADTPPIRLGACQKCGEARRECGQSECPRPLSNVFPPACPRCLQRGADCLCEQPPF
jgi:hypothetical protein